MTAHPLARASARRGDVLVNGAFLGQRITGQQRYAQELTQRLLRLPGFELARPPARVDQRSSLSWAWSQSLSLRAAVPRGRLLLTMTSRGPIWCSHQVLVVHDLFVLSHPEWFSPAYTRSHQPVLRAQLRSAAAFVAVSEPTRAELSAIVGDKPIVVVPNGVTQALQAEGPEPSGLGSTLRPRNFLLAVGSLDPRKNLDTLVEAYAALPEDLRRACPLVLAGGSSASFARVGEQRVVGVERLGYVEDDALAWLYQNARALVAPSLDEGFGLPVIEAAAAGTPVVLSDIPVFRWTYGDGGRYFDPRDVRALSALLRDVVEQEGPDAAHLLQKASDVRQRFDWDRSASILQEFLGAR